MRFARGQRSIWSMSSTSNYNLEKPAAETAACLDAAMSLAASTFRRAFGTDHD